MTAGAMSKPPKNPTPPPGKPHQGFAPGSEREQDSQAPAKKRETGDSTLPGAATQKPVAKQPKPKTKPRKRRASPRRESAGAPSKEITSLIKWLGGEKAKGRARVLYERLAHATLLVREMSKHVPKQAGNNSWLRLYAEALEDVDRIGDAIVELESAGEGPAGDGAPNQGTAVANRSVGSPDGGGSPDRTEPETATNTSPADEMLQ